MNLWPEVTLEDVYAEGSRNGLTRPKSVRGTGYPMINMGELFAHERIGAIEMERVQMSERELAAFSVLKGDLLFARQSLVAAGAGKCSIVKAVAEPTTFESHLIRIRLNEQKADPSFFFYYFLSPIGKGNVQSLVMQVAAAGIRGSELAKLRVPLPPLPTQQRIASILSTYDDLIENNQRRIRILEDMARSLYREWFVHFRYPGHASVPLVDSPLGPIPQGWEVKRLGDLFDFIGGSQPPKIEHIHEERSGYVRFIQNRDYGSSNHLTYIVESHRNKLCDRLDIMVDKYGEPGKTRFGLAGAYNVALAKLLPHKISHREWLRGLISEPDFGKYLEGASMAATRASLNSSHFMVDVAVPSNDIAEAYQRHTEPILKKILLHQDTIATLRRTRDLLLPRLLSGQVALDAGA